MIELWTSKTDIRYLYHSHGVNSFQTILDKLSSRVSQPISPYLRHVVRSLEWKSLIRNRFQRLKEHAEIPAANAPLLYIGALYIQIHW